MFRRQVVANEPQDEELHRDSERDDRPDRETRRDQKARDHGEDVADRIEDAVAVVVERNRHLAIAIDHHVGVLEDLPRRFEHHRQQQPRADGPAPAHQPEQAVESKAVNDVREGVPVGDVL